MTLSDVLVSKSMSGSRLKIIITTQLKKNTSQNIEREKGRNKNARTGRNNNVSRKKKS
jgi:hypothetical protein